MTLAFIILSVALFAAILFLIFKQRQIQQALTKEPEFQTPMVLLQQQVEALREQVRANLEGNSQVLQTQLGDLNRQLNDRLKDSSQMQQKSQESLNQRLDNAAKVVGEVQGKLGKLEESSQRLFEVGKDIRSLQEILRAPKLRGSLGEYFLSDLLAQILPKEYFTLQHAFKNGEKVDAVIQLGGKWVPIDAKFPLENFQRFLACEQEDEKKGFKKAFVSDVKKHIDAIANKYIRPDEGTFDFALMFVPAENIYYEVIVKDEITEGDHQLANFAMGRKVIPVSPNTLYVYLNTIVLGLKGLRIEKAAAEILKSLSRLSSDFNRLSDSFRKVGVHLHNAQSSFTDAEGRLVKFGDKMERLHGVSSEEEKEIVGNEEGLKLIPKALEESI